MCRVCAVCMGAGLGQKMRVFVVLVISAVSKPTSPKEFRSDSHTLKHARKLEYKTRNRDVLSAETHDRVAKSRFRSAEAWARSLEL